MRTKSLLPIDQLNTLTTLLVASSQGGDPLNKETIIDALTDVLIMAYVFGCDATNQDLDVNLEPDLGEMNISILKTIEGKTWKDRITEYIDEYNDSDRSNAGNSSSDTNNGSADSYIPKIQRVAETETHRVYNEGQYNTAKKSGLNAKKTWVTMLDEKVRDTHSFLEGVTVGLDEKFYSISGASAMHPGGFGVPEEDCNCRCELMMSK